MAQAIQQRRRGRKSSQPSVALDIKARNAAGNVSRRPGHGILKNDFRPRAIRPEESYCQE